LIVSFDSDSLMQLFFDIDHLSAALVVGAALPTSDVSDLSARAARTSRFHRASLIDEMRVPPTGGDQSAMWIVPAMISTRAPGGT
jgi:hypothetical protein